MAYRLSLSRVQSLQTTSLANPLSAQHLRRYWLSPRHRRAGPQPVQMQRTDTFQQDLWASGTAETPS